MDRKSWLTMIYREANQFIQRHANKDGKMSETEVDEYEPELHQQVQQSLIACDSLEDVIKYSLLKNPPPDLWYGENSWPHVLVGVASVCLAHDVKGIVLKILAGELPRADPNQIIEPPCEGIE